MMPTQTTACSPKTLPAQRALLARELVLLDGFADLADVPVGVLCGGD
jgi:hypothetical protein